VLKELQEAVHITGEAGDRPHGCWMTQRLVMGDPFALIFMPEAVLSGITLFLPSLTVSPILPPI
jgi:hypothetical protein